jgi:hypothetical protein
VRAVYRRFRARESQSSPENTFSAQSGVALRFPPQFKTSRVVGRLTAVAGHIRSWQQAKLKLAFPFP